MLFTHVEFFEKEDKLEIRVRPGNYVSNYISLVFYTLLMLSIDCGALWFYFSQGANAFSCFLAVAVFSFVYILVLRWFVREMFREVIIIDKDNVEIKIKKPFGGRKISQYKRGGIFNFRYGDQHIEGNLLFTYENKIVRFCRMLHPEDTVGVYEKVLKYFNTIGHLIKPGDNDELDCDI